VSGRAPISASSPVNVSQFIDEMPLNGFHVRLVLLTFLVLLVDGFDGAIAPYVSPQLALAWHVTNRAAFGPVFSAIFIGTLVGAPLFGYLGDRYGRKWALIVGAVSYALLTIATTQVHSLQAFFWLRLLSGLCFGGVWPNAIALNMEFAPKRMRATFVVLIFFGTTFGAALPGPFAAWLVPQYGWQVLFYLGGIVSLVVGLALIFALPESLRFLVLQEKFDRALRVANAFAGRVRFEAATLFVVDAGEGREKHALAELFRGKLALITPLLWLLFCINLMTLYFLNQWFPLVFSDAGLPPRAVALAITYFQVGGTIGGVFVMRPLDRFGFAPVVLLFIVASPIIAAIGYLTWSEAALMTAVFFSGFCLLANQSSINALAGIVYPTGVRSFGVGWALGVGRIGSIAGPIVGGVLVAQHLPVVRLYQIGALPVLLGAVTAFALARIHSAQARQQSV
jgi:AAHS family 4-hydroxybenzoate transporter-like MFS transporter